MPATTSKRPDVLDQYDVSADAKKRISLRGAKWKHYHVKVLTNGSYLLEPRVLVSPTQISPKTLKTIERSMVNFKKGAVSEPIDLTRFQKD